MMASLRFAVENLKVQNIVILGHSDCNAVAKLQHLEELTPEIRGATLEEAIKNNVLDQLDHLKQIPCVAQAVQVRGLNLEGMYFHIHTGRMERYNAVSAQWEFISTEEK